jgi:hypothetical protein
MTERIKYKFICRDFHNMFRNYDQFDGCSCEKEAFDYNTIKQIAADHLMQPKDIAEHHYQDNPGLNVLEDLDAYFRSSGGGI